MNLLPLASAAFALCVAATGFSQSRSDQENARDLPRSFCSAFNKHDGHQLANLMAEDVDFVTVGATWLHGRGDFERYHTRLLAGRFKHARIELLQTAVRFLRPDMAIVHWSWAISGDRNPDGTLRQRRYGMMTMIATKHAGSWRIVASQNDNSFPGSPPELQGITSPMPIPDQVGPQPSNP